MSHDAETVATRGFVLGIGPVLGVGVGKDLTPRIGGLDDWAIALR